jgi:hypothetical protein
MKRKLLSGEPTPITYAGERPREVLEEDRAIASFPIRAVREENITHHPDRGGARAVASADATPPYVRP